MNHVYLNSSYNEYYVDEATYQRIVEIVQANKHCTFTYQGVHPYTQDNPCVGRSICLEHLLEKKQYLVYAGQSGFDRDHARIYQFLDSQGYVYTSIEDSTQEMTRDTVATLAYYGFTPPETIIHRGKAVAFYSYYACLYGDLPTASVIVLSYNQSQEKVKGLFLLYKNGKTVPLSKKSDLYLRAEELVNKPKEKYNTHEGEIYEVVSQLESAMYDVSVKLLNGNVRSTAQEENSNES